MSNTSSIKHSLFSFIKYGGYISTTFGNYINKPNVFQTLENTPALVHAGPFANIAHGNSSVLADQIGIKTADYLLTEAGFGADIGAEKFFNIKCRKSGLSPDAVVIVATVRALKMHGGVPRAELDREDVAALERGLENLGRHIRNTGQYGVPLTVAINHFVNDTDAEVEAVKEYVATMGAEAVVSRHWELGGEGAKDLAEKVVEIIDGGSAQYAPLYPDEMGLFQKMETIAREIYRADEVLADQKIRNQLKDWEDAGYGDLPVCMAKTQYSFSTDPTLRGAPTGHSVPVREVRLSAGAGFIVAVCGDIMTMPGLPRKPAAESIRFNDAGEIEGLF